MFIPIVSSGLASLPPATIPDIQDGILPEEKEKLTEYQLTPAEPLRRFCAAALQRVGVSAEDAATVADTLVEADLRGVHSHGVWWLTRYTRRLRHGGLNPKPNLKVAHETPAMLLLDADRAMGQIAAVAAMRHAIRKAKFSGASVVGVRNSNHFGAAAYYALMAPQENQIGFATTDAEPTMASWGGTHAVVGNNPLAFAVPTGRNFTLVLDMAQSVVAWGKIFLAAQRGEKIPSSWAFNAAGEPTEDPQEAMAGLLMPVGGYKGYGLALVMEILSGVLTGAAFGLSIPPMADETASQGHGHFFMALDIAQFMPLTEFQERMDVLIAQQREVPLAKGVERIYLPGEIEHFKREQRLKTGIPLEPYVIEALAQLGVEMDLDTTGLRPGSRAFE
ncbi:MAG: lactate dehydrogenase [Acidobacteria bacterium]|nr:MAG: lactate dehydrogenase [Acidobacteriota bacterium]